MFRERMDGWMEGQMERKERGRIHEWIDGWRGAWSSALKAQLSMAASLRKEGIKSRRKVWEGVSCLELHLSQKFRGVTCGDRLSGLPRARLLATCLPHASVSSSEPRELWQRLPPRHSLSWHAPGREVTGNTSKGLWKVWPFLCTEWKRWRKKLPM